MKSYRKIALTIGIGTVVLAALLFAYLFSYRCSYLLTDGGTMPKYELVICGLHLPYNTTSAEVFSAFYRPLIEKDAATAPLRRYQGVISFPVSDPQSISVTPPKSDVGIDMVIPADLLPETKKLVQGQQVSVVCGSEPMPGQPFCLRNQLVAIVPSSE